MSIHKYATPTGETRYRVIWRDPNGAQRSKTVKTMSDARRLDAEVKTGHAPTRAPRDALTVEAWVVEWFELHSREWALRTVNNRRSTFTKWILPIVGAEPLVTLTRKRIREMRATIIERGASNYTANKCVVELSAALGAAVDNELLEDNPCSGIKRLPTPPADTKALTPAEVEAVRRWMPTDRDRLIVSLIAYAGLRPGEVRALEWHHIGDRMILVEQAAQDDTIATTKTKKRRSVPICAELAADIAEHGRGLPGTLVCPGARGGILDWKNWRRRVWDPACAKAGVNARAYDLRHTFASVALEAGAPIMQVQSALGHTRASMTLDTYAHAYEMGQLATPLPGLDAAIRAARTDQAATRAQRPLRVVPPLPESA